MNLIASNLLELSKTFKSAREMARFLDISYTTLHQYLKGRVPPADFIILVCERFGVNYEWLLTGNGEMFQNSSVKNDTQQPQTHGQAELQQMLAQIVTALEKSIKKGGYKVSPKLKGEIVAAMYFTLIEQGKTDIADSAPKIEEQIAFALKLVV